MHLNGYYGVPMDKLHEEKNSQRKDDILVLSSYKTNVMVSSPRKPLLLLVHLQPKGLSHQTF